MSRNLIPEGPYRGRVTKQGFTVAKNTANMAFYLTFEVFDASDEKVERTVYWYWTDKTVDQNVEKLKRLGFVPNSFSEIDPLRENHHSYVGVEAELYCRHERYDGKDREKWDLSNPDFVGPKAATGDEISKLDAMFGRSLKVAAMGEKQPAAAQPPSAAPAGNDDDIPF